MINKKVTEENYFVLWLRIHLREEGDPMPEVPNWARLCLSVMDRNADPQTYDMYIEAAERIDQEG